MFNIEVVALPVIIILTYCVVELYKRIIANSDKVENLKKLIPAIAGIVGVGLGIICFYWFPEIIMADSIANAIATGFISGLAATGSHECITKFRKLISGEESEVE